MKIYNKILAALLVPAMGIAVTSCDDKNPNEDYVPQPVVGNFAYFPSNISTTFEISESVPYVDVPVYRGSEEGSLTVEIDITPVPGASVDLTGNFQYDTTVTFNPGETVAYIRFNYDISDFEYNDEADYILTIPDEYVTPYGLSTEEITIVYPEPWIEIGEGFYYDEFFVAGDEVYGVITTFFQNGLNPNRYRIVNPYYPMNEEETFMEFQVLQPGDKVGNVTVTLDNLVYFSPMPTLYDDSAGDFISIVWPGDFGYNSETDWTGNIVFQYQEKELNGVKLPGEIRLAPVYALLDLGGYYPTDGVQSITIIFPGFQAMDLAMSVSYEGILTNTSGSYAVADVSLGDDVASAKVGIGAGSNSSKVIEGIKDGSIDTVDITEGGNVKIPFNNMDEGKYTIAVVGYQADGSDAGTTFTTFEYEGSASGADWKSLGYVEYTESFLSAIYGLYDEFGLIQYRVEIQERASRPGYYRLVNPYGQDVFPLAQEIDFEYASTAPSYIRVDATNPNKVRMPECPQSIIMDEQYGPVTCLGLADYFIDQGNPEETVEEYGYFGTLKDNVISFTAQTLGVMEGNAGPFTANAILIGVQGNNPLFLTNDDGKTYFAPFVLNLNDLTQTEPASSMATRTVMNYKLKRANLKQVSSDKFGKHYRIKGRRTLEYK